MASIKMHLDEAKNIANSESYETYTYKYLMHAHRVIKNHLRKDMTLVYELDLLDSYFYAALADLD